MTLYVDLAIVFSIKATIKILANFAARCKNLEMTVCGDLSKACVLGLGFCFHFRPETACSLKSIVSSHARGRVPREHAYTPYLVLSSPVMLRAILKTGQPKYM